MLLVTLVFPATTSQHVCSEKGPIAFLLANANEPKHVFI